jgi:hypothetical protein
MTNKRVRDVLDEVCGGSAVEVLLSKVRRCHGTRLWLRAVSVIGVRIALSTIRASVVEWLRHVVLRAPVEVDDLQR